MTPAQSDSNSEEGLLNGSLKLHGLLKEPLKGLVEGLFEELFKALLIRDLRDYLKGYSE